MKFLFLFLALSSSAFANPHVYELKNLRAATSSLYNTAQSQRHFLRFQNEQGTHTVIYDESAASPPLKEIAHLLVAMKHSTCTLELECKVKAFCTGADCRNMYYEMTNAPQDLQFAPRDKCRLKSYSCGTGQ